MDDRLKEEAYDDGSCGGNKRCKDRKFNDKNDDCLDCLRDAEEAIRECLLEREKK
jgi:hypothetical protein